MRLHRIERLMRAQALRARPRRRRRPADLGERPDTAIAPNVSIGHSRLLRPTANGSDFTYIWTAEGWLYVAAVLDLFAPGGRLVDERDHDGPVHRRSSRPAVDGRPGDDNGARPHRSERRLCLFIATSFVKVLRRPFESAQYASDQFQRLMVDYGIVCSRSRAGNIWDNAAMESFFSSLKTERTARKTYRPRDQAKADVFDYIERFYNPRRRHSTIGYLSPMEFEKLASLA